MVEMPWYFYVGMVVLLVVMIGVHPAVLYFIWYKFDLWPKPEKEGQLVFDDGDFEIRRMSDGSTKVEWSTQD